MVTALEIRLLGPVEVRNGDDRAVPLAGTRALSVLAMLALRCGDVLPDDQLIDALWHDDVPSRPRNALQRQVSTLRSALGRTAPICRRGGGYVLDLDQSAIDSFRFDALAAHGHELMQLGDAAGARASFDMALQLWRGAPLADVAQEQFAQLEVIRLGEARLAALEARLDADLALGRDVTLIGELEQLVLEHPFREHLRAQLMLALARSGRQADALRAYQSARSVLGDELGLEPSAELRSLEAAILRQEIVAARPVPDPDPRRRTNMRQPLTSLVGRQLDLNGLRSITQDHRLVTLVGPGGVGKSRLALEAARDRLGDGTLDVWFVELAELTDDEAVLPTIMTTIGIPAGETPATRETLVEFLGACQTLLVFDNCEHLVDPVSALVQELLGHCPTLRVWTTSREGLGIAGEVLWPVEPLPLADAVALFVERGCEADPTSHLDGAEGHDLAVLERICARLDGLPLAIELAAARLRSMPVTELSSGLRDRFRMLNRGVRTAAPRQRTLRAVVDWSYDLLFDDERRVFERLGVFGGSCTLAAAQVVCGDDEISADDVTDLVSRLAEKSLVRVELGHDGLARCFMLQTLVDYARDRLEDSDELDRVRAKYVDHYSNLAASSVAALEGTHQRHWLRVVSANLANLRSAFDVALVNGNTDCAHLIAGGIGWYWWFTGRASEGLHWLQRASECGDACGALTTARTLAWLAFAATPGFVEWVEPGEEGVAATRPLHGRATVDADSVARIALDRLLDAAPSAELAGIAIALSVSYSARGDDRSARALLADVGGKLRGLLSTPSGEAMATYVAARCAYIDNRYADSERGFRRSGGLFASLDAEVYQAFALRYVGRIALLRGDPEASVAAIEEALELARSLGLSGYANTLVTDLGESLAAAGDLDPARSVLRGNLSSARAAGSSPGITESLTALALVEWRSGDAEQAATLAQEALEVAQEIGERASAMSCLAVLALVALKRGDPHDARSRYIDALRLTHRRPECRGAAIALEGLAAVALALNEGNDAARLLGAAHSLRQCPGQAIGPASAMGLRCDVGAMLQAATSLVGREAAARAYSEGLVDPDGVIESAVADVLT